MCYTCNPVARDRRTLITKENYEGKGNDANLNIEEWGSVGFNMRQALHALVYAWIIREGGGVGAISDKKVRITNFEIRYLPNPRACILALCSVFAFVFTAGSLATLVLACLEDKNVVVVEIFWSLGIVFAIIPSVLVLPFISTMFRTNFRATAEVSSKTDNTVIDLTIANGIFYPIAVGNDIMTGAYTSATI